MTDTVKFKVFSFVKALLMMTVLLSALKFPYASVASAAEAVSAYFTEPQPLYEILENGTIHIKCYWVKYESETYYLVELDAIYPSGTHFGVKGSGKTNTMWLSDLQPVSGNTYTYNLIDGRLMTTTTPNGTQTQQTFGNLNKPNFFRWINNTVNNGFFPSDSNITSDPQGEEAYPVEWAREPIPINHYRSYLPEPHEDEYNKYIVLTGPEHSMLLWFSYKLAELYTWETTINGDTFQYDLRQYLTPTVIVTDSGFSVYLTVPQSFLDYQAITGYPDMISFSCCIYVYDLITGEFISSTTASQNGFVTSGPITILSLPAADGVDGIDIYGAVYVNASQYYKIHKASVTYSVDPSFDVWQASVITWLEQIYNSISQTVDTSDVEISQDMGAITEYESARDALVVTGDNGQAINAAQDAQIQFEVIGSQVQQMAPQFDYQNNLVQQLLDIHPKLIILIVFALASSVIVIIFGRKLNSK